MLYEDLPEAYKKAHNIVNGMLLASAGAEGFDTITCRDFKSLVINYAVERTCPSHVSYGLCACLSTEESIVAFYNRTSHQILPLIEKGVM